MIQKLLYQLGLKKIEHPFFIGNHEYFKNFDQNKPLADYDFVVFDTELTGLDRKRDQIVSIGAVRIKKLRIMPNDNFIAYVKPTRSLPKDSTLIHQITPEQIEHAPPLGEILPGFLDFCGKSLLVGHYIGLDVDFVNQACSKFFQGTLANPCIDTMRMARTFTEIEYKEYYDQFRVDVAYDLTALNERYQLPPFTPHDAFEDALQTAYLFIYLAKKMQEYKIITLRDLFRAGQGWRLFF